jgi:CheY-like chemotaxis protein
VARCFEPFFTTKGDRGTGLGLPMVYGILKRHEAAVEIESKPGEGTTFRMQFPKRPSTVGRAAQKETPLLPERLLRVLCVDDDAMLLESLLEMLRMDGHKAEGAADGELALGKLKTAFALGTPPDVVITDLGMPRMDGRELSERIHREYPEMPVVLLTGWGSQLMDQADRMKEFCAVLSKPPRSNELRAALARAVSGKL